jgi:hypothetical protein
MKVTTKVSDGMNPAEIDKSSQPDPFWDMALQAQASGVPSVPVRVSFGDTVECLDPTGRKRWPKCEVSVQLECPPTAEFIMRAKEFALQHAVAYVNNAMVRVVPDYTPIRLG